MLTRVFFRVMLVGLGVWLVMLGARDFYQPLMYRLTGSVVEGEVIGFWAGRPNPSIQPESTAIRNGHRFARRPAYKYPTHPGAAMDRIGKPGTSFTFSFNPYQQGEKVTVVFPKGQPEQAVLFAAATLAGGLGLFGAGLLCLYIGLGGRL